MGLLGWIGGFLARQRPSQTVRIVRDRPIRARYDLAQTTNDNKNHWAAADSYDADSANSAAVRSTTVRRSRYETENNGYAKGMLRTMANYTVGRGPKLRLQTRSAGFNAMVQAAWNRWAKRVKLGRKLRTAVKARCRDGEAFLVAKINDNLRDPVKLDLVGVECEQVTSTDLLFAEKNRVDGVRFDDFGNPVAYDILPYHPGGQWWPTSTKAERVDAKFVFHLFQEERPRQHRAIPECSSTLPTCAQSRRWREATLQAAENLADFSLFLKSQDTANTEADFTVPPLATLEIEKGLKDGKTKYAIGHEIAAWIKKLFEADVRPDTIRVRATRMEEALCTNVHTDSTPQDQTETPEISNPPEPEAEENLEALSTLRVWGNFPGPEQPTGVLPERFGASVNISLGRLEYWPILQPSRVSFPLALAVLPDKILPICGPPSSASY